MSKPFTGDSLKKCPNCRIVHPVKTVHLWLDDTGACLVSTGVLEDLKSAGMPQLDIVGEVNKPPTLRLGMSREKQDQEARRLVIVRR
jgi:hypothetical protein